MSQIINNSLYCCLWHGDDLRVHGVLVGIRRLYRLEGAGAHMQCDLGRLYAPLAQTVKYLIGEMQTRSRSRYRTFDTLIDSLVGGLIALLRLTI